MCVLKLQRQLQTVVGPINYPWCLNHTQVCSSLRLFTGLFEGNILTRNHGFPDKKMWFPIFKISGFQSFNSWKPNPNGLNWW